MSANLWAGMMAHLMIGMRVATTAALMERLMVVSSG